MVSILRRIRCRISANSCNILLLLLVIFQVIVFLDNKRRLDSGDINASNFVSQLLKPVTGLRSKGHFSVDAAVKPTKPDLGHINNFYTVEISGSGNQYIFSAYYEDRLLKPTVRIIAAAKLKLKHVRVYCHLEFPRRPLRVVQPAVKMKPIRENWGFPYSAYFIDCEVGSHRIPSYVTLSHSANVSSAPRVPVTHVPKNASRQGDFAVCVKPFHYDYNRAVWLVEFIELYRIFGVDHFVFYNHSVGADVQRVLEKYIADGLVTVLPWQLPLVSQKDIRTEGIFVALNDCVYRTKYRYDFAVLVDFDEYIVPRKQRTYPELVKYLSMTRKNIGALTFKNVFFYLYWSNDTTVYENLDSVDPEDVPYLITLFKTRRMVKPHKHGARSKFFVNPVRTFEVGNHMVWESVKGSANIFVHDEHGLSHHYRICEFGGFDCLNHQSTVDRTTHRYQKQLLSAVLETCKQSFPQEKKCPVAPPLGSPW